MNKYRKENLILGDSLEYFFGWITLPIRDSASRHGVGVGNTPYQVLPAEFWHVPGAETNSP